MRILLNIVASLLLVLFFSLNTYSQEFNGNTQRIKHPLKVSQGILFTDNQSSSLFIFNGYNMEKILSSPGCGNYFTISDSKDKVGVKLIGTDGVQQPVLMDLDLKEIVTLHEKAEQVGQVSFSKNGKIAFTIGNELIVLSEEGKESFNLGTYSNLAPLSPDGSKAVFNDLNDQLKLIDLSTREIKQFSDGERGYYNPIWSTDGEKILFSSLNGFLHVYYITSNRSLTIGEGYSPAWSEDSETIIYYKTELERYKLKNTDIFAFNLITKTEKNLTNTPTEFEVDPSFISESKIVFTKIGKDEIIKADFNNTDLELINTEIYQLDVDKAEIEYYNLDFGKEEIETIDIPYVHQVYDTPDWHNGHASCAPTAAIMTIAYFNILPPWAGWCSSPSPGHYNNFGRYVAEKYRFRENFYETTANDWGGNTAYGGYGYMWNGSFRPYTRMALYYQRHGINAQQSDSPPYSDAIGEINSGFPYTMCVLLTTSGHLIIANGIHIERTLIFNDPYGNKNTPGYPSYDGKNVKYDWPGYNNGFQNLNSVAWCIKTRYTKVAAADTIVDNMQFNLGFYLHTGGASSMARWRDKNTGYKNHMWWTYSNPSKTLDTSYAIWRANLTENGHYELFTFIPFSNATYALYKIYHKDGFDTVSINQKNYTNEWVSLGSFNFSAGNTGYVRLGDATGIAGQEIVFDAVKWSYLGPFVGVETENEIPEKYSLSQNYPNPFNPGTKIKFTIPSNVKSQRSNTMLKVFDVLGNEIAVLVNEPKVAGTYEIEFATGSFGNGSGLSSGVYFYRLVTDDFIETKKMLLLR